MAARVALAGCRELADPDAPLLIGALSARGITAVEAAWDDPEQDWSSYDLVVVRSTWDYVERLPELLAWADRVPRLANTADVLRWNTDKRYLDVLAAAGVPVVPTTFLTPGERTTWEPPGEEYVVKPTVSAGAYETARYRSDQVDAARAHVDRLLASGQGVMIQPYLRSVEQQGETSLLFFGGELSHSIRKGAVLAGASALGAHETPFEPRRPTAEEQALARQVLSAAPGPLLYARVDLLPGPDGPVLLELELTEPFFFLATAPGAPDRFAAAIAGWPS